MLAGIFFNGSVLVQAFLVPVFFILRSWYEYAADSITAKTFGSDSMPVVSFGGRYFIAFRIRHYQTQPTIMLQVFRCMKFASRS